MRNLSKIMRVVQIALVLGAVLTGLSWFADDHAPQSQELGEERLTIRTEAPVQTAQGPWTQDMVFTQDHAGVPLDIAPTMNITAAYQNDSFQSEGHDWTAKLRFEATGDEGNTWWSTTRALPIEESNRSATVSVDLPALVREGRELEQAAGVPSRLSLGVDVQHEGQVTVANEPRSTTHTASVDIVPREGFVVANTHPDSTTYTQPVEEERDWTPAALFAVAVIAEGGIRVSRRNDAGWKHARGVQAVEVASLSVPDEKHDVSLDALLAVAREQSQPLLVDEEAGLALVEGPPAMLAQLAPPEATIERHGPADDSAASEVVGSLIMAAMTVTLSVFFGQSLLGAIPDAGPAPSTIEFDVAAGQDGWDSGDEMVTIRHTGGASLARDDTRIKVTVGSTQHTYEGEGLEGPFEDAKFTIGERWRINLTIPASTHVDVQVLHTDPSAQVVASTMFLSPEPTCEADTTEPDVATWTQEPESLEASLDGPLEVTATVEDDCSSVITDEAPHLTYRFDDAANYTDAGAADSLGGRTWQGQIPEPADGWDAHAGETLTYRLDPLEDTAGNTGPSQSRSIPVGADKALEGQLTYLTNHTIFSGSMENFAAAQNGTDGGEAAILEEQETSSGASSSEAYATAHSSSSGTEDPGDATGSPDDVHARVDEDDEWVAVEGFQTFSGDIHAVELAFQAQDEGDGAADDEMKISYRVNNRKGKTSETYDASELDAGTDNDTVFLNVTADRDWSWDDVDVLQVRATYDRKGALDDVSYAVDALWVRVNYEDPAYNLSVQGKIEDLPAGDQTLELRYAISEETHHVDVWNFTDESWQQRGSALTSTSMRNWSLALTTDEVSGNNTRFRIVDDGVDPDARSTVDLDYARGRTR